VYVYLNGARVIVGSGVNVGHATYTISLSDVGISTAGTYPLQILVLTMGAQNCCGGLEDFTRGLQGTVRWGSTDITASGWTQVPGLQGEALTYWNSTKAAWTTGAPANTPLIWYKIPLVSPQPVSQLPSWQLDMGSAGKGILWINGHLLGRYWDIVATKSTCPDTCDYRGSYGGDKCRYDCGKPSLQFYHVPRSWLLSEGQTNTIVILEERGAKDVTQIKLIERN